jgi:hypothetical protein
MHISIHIQMPAYLVKYLHRKLGSNYKLSNKDHFGQVLLANIVGKSNRLEKSDRKISSFCVNISEDYLYRYQKASITPEGKKAFAAFVEKMFLNELCMFIYSRATLRPSMKSHPGAKYLVSVQQALRDFLHYYNILEDEYSHETAQRYFDRWHSKLKKAQNPNSINA